MEEVLRRWKFWVEDDAGEGRYVGPDGKPNDDEEWIGTDAQAVKEADRRADLWEDLPGSGWISRVVYESQGKVGKEDLAK